MDTYIPSPEDMNFGDITIKNVISVRVSSESPLTYVSSPSCTYVTIGIAGRNPISREHIGRKRDLTFYLGEELVSLSSATLTQVEQEHDHDGSRSQLYFYSSQAPIVIGIKPQKTEEKPQTNQVYRPLDLD